VVEHSVEIHRGLVAALFARVGIWLGLRPTQHTETVVVREVEVPAPVNFVRDERKLESLGIMWTKGIGYLTGYFQFRGPRLFILVALAGLMIGWNALHLRHQLEAEVCSAVCTDRMLRRLWITPG
jgi:hypothetical protein